MGRITKGDLDGLLSTERDILSLPSTEPVADHEPLSTTPEFKFAEEGHDHEMVLIIQTCTEVGALCAHHADELLASYFNERALRVEGKELELSVCEDCGKKVIDCLKIRAINPAFLGMAG